MTTTKFKPLLAGKAPEDLSAIKYPVLASPKLDGIRCVKLDGKALSRSLKPIPNDHIRNWIEQNLPDGIDGEILLPNWTEEFRLVSSAVMKKSGEPAFFFAAFDLVRSQDEMFLTFSTRLKNLADEMAPHDHDGTSHVASRGMVPQTLVHDEEELLATMAQHLAKGYEGTMIRDPLGPYKCGRSTTREGILLKLKKWDDEEATVYGVEEEMENTNEAKTNAVGRTERSTKKEGMVGKGRVGRLLCRFDDGAEFGVGSGLTEDLKNELWISTTATGGPGSGCIGQKVKIKHQPPPGGRKAGEAPRFPVFLGFRHPDDM